MTIAKHFALSIALTFFALSINTPAQTPAIEVSTDNDSAQFSTQGQAQSVHVEIFAPSGALVFESDTSNGQLTEWPMVNQKGERVVDGVYLATITVTDLAGKRRKRIEQITVSTPEGAEKTSSALMTEPPTPNAPPTITGQGTGTATSGNLARFTGASSIGNSVVSQSATNNVGINTAAPTATLHINKLQPAAVATSAVATQALLQTSGGTGGNTTGTTGQHAGAGASIALIAGNGGTASGRSRRGNGGNITLQPGSSGAGAGTAGVNGNVLIAPSGVGRVGIGTAAPASLLTVIGNTTLPVVAATNTSTSGSAINGVSNSGFGVHGETSSGTTGAGVHGVSTASDGNGIIAEANTGTEAFAIWGKSTNGEAGHFTGKVVINGDLDILGNLSKDSGSFKIDHPLDPANKYLYHSFVESSDMMNIYNGNVTLDQRGEAAVTMPRWFNALNKEFRYQLTAIGAPGPNLYIAEEVKGNRFRIAGGTPGMKVSWQVTGIRKDVYAEAHRIPVEQDKPERERGSFLHPELHGQPKDKSLERVRYPKKMQRAEENESQQPTNRK